MEKIKLFEMFAGYGGATFALKKVDIDFECVGYSEIDKNAIKIYELNHPGIKNYGDCTKINPKELPDFDILTAGFPCQPFSVNTNKNARGSSHKDFNLFKDIIRILEDKKPTYILLENVKGILGKKSKEVHDELIKNLKDLGYEVRVVLVNSINYGTPQNRERVLFIGKLGKFEEGEFILPKEEELKKSVLNILEDNPIRREPAIKYKKLNKEVNIKKFGDISRLDAILLNRVEKRKSNIMFEILDAPSNVVSRQSDRIYKPTFSPCLTATGSDYLFCINDKIIVLTPKECFRLMGFLGDEINLGDLSENQKYKLAGNGWDINLMSRVLKNLIKQPIIIKNKETNDIFSEIIDISNMVDLKKEYKVELIKFVMQQNHNG